MQRKFYIDTSVWRDYFEDRMNCIRPLGELAFEFLKKCRENNDEIIVSDLVEYELLKYFSREKIDCMFLEFSEQIIWIEYSEKQADEAKKLWIREKKNIPYWDILHSIIARDNDAILISRDAHFGEIGICWCNFPEEIY